MLAAAACCASLLAPAAGGAATVVNGGFETGTLEGWTQVSANPYGLWAPYFGVLLPRQREQLEETREEEEQEYEECLEGAVDPGECKEPEPKSESEFGEFFMPPVGKFAAVTAEGEESAMALYQDVALEPGETHQLSMLLYYISQVPIAVPSPNTLDATSSTAPENQQLRVDVIKPGAPIFTMEASDILATVFANKNGDPEVMGPTRYTADLSALAGQTVRIRISNAVNQEEFNAAVDDVAITSTPIPPSNVATKGKLKLNKKNGTAALSVTVPGPGVLGLVDAKTGKKRVLKPASLKVKAAGAVKLAIKPNGKGKKTLKKKGKLQFKGKLTFTPTGGTVATQSVSGKLKLNINLK